jgi:hypothetical protein
MHAKEKPVELTYKASITQSTGEVRLVPKVYLRGFNWRVPQDWKDVDLTLETAEPTFGVDLPRLTPWTISVHRQFIGKLKSGRGGGPPSQTFMSIASLPGGPGLRMKSTSDDGAGPMIEPEALVRSMGNITATFGVPGKITIPSDGGTHNVTIVKLNLDAKMRWISVPKLEAKTHLSVGVDFPVFNSDLSSTHFFIG